MSAIAWPELPDISLIPADLAVPAVEDAAPRAGARVRQVTAGWEGTAVHHVLYLPADWSPGRKFPVIVEYAGNGNFVHALGDKSSGTVEGSILGYGLSAGVGYIWICMPFVEVNPGGRENALTWWGDADETERYCIATVQDVCGRFGGSGAVLCGFSRGAIACNYIGLRNETIGKLWKAFLCHSHYDGVRTWPYPESDPDSAGKRLERLQGRPQFISMEGTTDPTRKFLESTGVKAPFTFVDFPFRNHTDAWALRDCDLRRQARAWLKSLC